MSTDRFSLTSLRRAVCSTNDPEAVTQARLLIQFVRRDVLGTVVESERLVELVGVLLVGVDSHPSATPTVVGRVRKPHSEPTQQLLLRALVDVVTAPHSLSAAVVAAFTALVEEGERLAVLVAASSSDPMPLRKPTVFDGRQEPRITGSVCRHVAVSVPDARVPLYVPLACLMLDGLFVRSATRAAAMALARGVGDAGLHITRLVTHAGLAAVLGRTGDAAALSEVSLEGWCVSAADANVHGGFGTAPAGLPVGVEVEVLGAVEAAGLA